jgi:hypothetical protein
MQTQYNVIAENCYTIVLVETGIGTGIGTGSDAQRGANQWCLAKRSDFVQKS